MRILFWAGIVFAVDALIGLLGAQPLARMLPGVPTEKIARAEGALALALLCLYFFLIPR